MRASLSLGLSLLSLVAMAQLPPPPPALFFSPAGESDGIEPAAAEIAQEVTMTNRLGTIYKNWLIVREPNAKAGIIVPAFLPQVTDRAAKIDLLRTLNKIIKPDGTVDQSQLSPEQIRVLASFIGIKNLDAQLRGGAKLVLLPGYKMQDANEHSFYRQTLIGDFGRDFANYVFPPEQLHTAQLIPVSNLPAFPEDWEIHAFGRPARALEVESAMSVFRQWCADADREIAGLDADLAALLPQTWYSRIKTAGDLPSILRDPVDAWFSMRWKQMGFTSEEDARKYASTMPLRWEPFVSVRLYRR